VKNGQIGRIFSHYLEEQVVTTESLLSILVCVYFREGLALNIKIVLKEYIITLKSLALTFFDDSCKVTV